MNQLWSRIRGLGPALARIFVLSALMQLVALVSPLYMQLAIDTALPNADVDLLNIIAAGFAALLVINAAVSWMRARLTVSLSNSLGLYMAVNLFRHTIGLPIHWFEKRHLGDIVSRFSSLQPITDLIGRGLVNALVDGLLATTTIILMLVYSPLLSLLTLSAVALYVGVKLAFFRSMKYANVNLLTAQAVESTNFLENMRGVSTIKMFCQEANRQRVWQNKRIDVVNNNIKLGKFVATFDAINGLVVGVENIVFIYVAVNLTMTGEITLGMVFAFQAYKQSFVGATTRLIDQVLNFRLLDVHLDRLSDIALEPGEPAQRDLGGKSVSTIELRNVSFSYGAGLPYVLRGVNMRLEPGKVTVLTGPSGSGKTTLMKILSGLLAPTSGEIFVDGIPLREFGLRAYRERLGVVSQDDVLFSGSMAENVAFFDPDYRIEDVRRVARQAAIDADIERMPMKYDTLVGDMGSTLSGGQKQRMLLARALYKAPDVLVLDEATSHLDVRTEMQVVSALKQIGVTRLMVAHRPDTIQIADCVYNVANGSVTRFSTVQQEHVEKV
jgi:ATP-binding cassette subfamily B protein RaxB